MLSDDQRRSFETDGVVTLPGALPDATWRPLADSVGAALDRAGWRTENGSTGSETNLSAVRKQVARAFRRGRLDGIYTDDLCTCARQLFTGDVAERSAALLLLTMPGHSVAGPTTRWAVPRSMWHTDAPRVTEPGVPGIIALAFLDTVSAGGGGTLLVAGSHRLLDAPGRALRSRDFKRTLRKRPYFKVLLGRDDPARSRFLEQSHCVDGVDVRLVELTGEPGDVVLADARILHAPAPNVGAKPRLMARGFFVGEPLAEHYRELWGEKQLSSSAAPSAAPPRRAHRSKPA